MMIVRLVLINMAQRVILLLLVQKIRLLSVYLCLFHKIAYMSCSVCRYCNSTVTIFKMIELQSQLNASNISLYLQWNDVCHIFFLTRFSIASVYSMSCTVSDHSRPVTFGIDFMLSNTLYNSSESL
jgi:hypothetical protein